MSLSYAERSDQLCDKLRELEHQAADADQLFYCAYLLGLLGVYGGVEGSGQQAFDQAFELALQDTLKQENVAQNDQSAILDLLHKVI